MGVQNITPASGLSRTASNPTQHGANPPRLTVIVATFNRVEALWTTLDQLLEQNFTDFELLVIDQSDAAGAAQIFQFIAERRDARMKYLHLTRKGLPNARNEGLARARGEVVVFVDDDVLITSKDFLSAHLAAYDDPEVGGVVGRHIERYIKTNVRQTACHVSWTGRTIFNLFGTERQAVRSCKGSNMSYRAAVLAQVGGFDRKTKMLEDTDFSVRVAKAGWTILFEPDAEVVHLSLKQGGVREATTLQQEYRRFRSTAYFVLKHRGAVGSLPFIVTFSAIALTRVARYRSLAVIPGFAGAIREGFATLEGGPDQDLPVVTRSSAEMISHAAAMVDVDELLEPQAAGSRTRTG